MERAWSIEEGLPTTRVPLLDSSPNLDDLGNGHGNGNDNDGPTVSSDPATTPVLVLSTFVAVCGFFCYGYALGYSSAAETGIVEDLGLSVAAYSLFGSIMTVGGMVGAISSGKISDLIGRRRTMWLSEILCTPGWLAIAFGKNAWWVDIGRLLVGLGIGLITYVVPIYIAEISPKSVRGRFASSSMLMSNCGFALVYFIGNFVSWRTLSLIGAIPCVVQLLGLFFIPESPRWLAKIGKEIEALAALQHLRGKNADICQEAKDVRIPESGQDKQEGGFLDLFQKRYSLPVTVAVGLMLLRQLGGNSALAFYCSSIFDEANFSTTIGTTAVAIVQVPIAVVNVLLMDGLGRRPLLMVSCAGACLFLSFLGSSFYLQEVPHLKEDTPIIAFLCLLVAWVAYGLGISPIPWVIMSEILPANIKAAGGSLATLVFWSSSWLTTYTFNFMFDWSPGGTILVFAAVSGLTVLFVWKLVPETKGRTLEEIQAALTNPPQRVY